MGGGSGGATFSSLEPNKMGPSAITAPTIEQYIAYEKGAQEVPQGQMTLDSHPMSCGSRATVFDANLDSWGAAFPGYMILNPGRLEGLATTVKFYIYYHECGHQFIGASEVGADCFAIRHGVKHGWLDANGMNEVCGFISQLKGDAVHPPGPRRCELMRQCYAMALHEKGEGHKAAQ